MSVFKKIAIGIVLAQLSFNVFAQACPDPLTTSLQNGVVPEPWLVNPFSPNPPRGDVNTSFVKANILVAGYGRGVACRYRTSTGDYSIWWPVLTKIPAVVDYKWIDTLGGFVCVLGLNECQFYVADV